MIHLLSFVTYIYFLLGVVTCILAVKFTMVSQESAGFYLSQLIDRKGPAWSHGLIVISSRIETKKSRALRDLSSPRFIILLSFTALHTIRFSLLIIALSNILVKYSPLLELTEITMYFKPNRTFCCCTPRINLQWNRDTCPIYWCESF